LYLSQDPNAIHTSAKSAIRFILTNLK
ncbi:MAG: hypothetical protein RIQ61_958, partial [Bacteroidota bacterium]